VFAPGGQRRAIEASGSAAKLARHAFEVVALSATLARKIEVEAMARESD
jgi:hypothetical protein